MDINNSFVNFNGLNRNLKFAKLKKADMEEISAKLQKGNEATTQALGEEGGDSPITKKDIEEVPKDTKLEAPKSDKEEVKSLKDEIKQRKNISKNKLGRNLPSVDYDYSGYVKIHKSTVKFNPKVLTTQALGEEGGSKYPNLSEY